ncbi:MAG: FAD-dependent oxidoreductase [Candidatus Scatomorpha sp.]|jgi:succinate dehydrogenase/fumarate reductase flavoprotein subunit
MLLKKKLDCNVLVIGSGIAGISAALAAAESGSSVILACKGKLFSGSSFYPGTWGLGLIGPADKSDEADLAKTIQTVGCQMATAEMVEAFVSGITPAIARVRKMGVKLRRADSGTQKEYVPCFDYKHRDWNGIEYGSIREIFSRRLKELNVRILARCEVLDLNKSGDCANGAVVLFDSQLQYISCGALVLASGGYGSIFKYHLCTEDVLGSGQHMALKAGCKLVNMEFMQMMPGYIKPAYKTIFNEKIFHFSDFKKADGSDLLNKEQIKTLEIRSGHGPFTSRLDSKVVDFALFKAFTKDEGGVKVTYSEEMKKNPPEFVQVYFDWLKQAKGITADDPIYIGVFAHAANGGVRINPDASTDVPGLFAAGEVTGGMHGADRIGGLSTANGLVFGAIAGHSAAEFAAKAEPSAESCMYIPMSASGCEAALKKLQQTMFQNAMVLRCEQGLLESLSLVQSLRSSVAAKLRPDDNFNEVAKTQRFLARCTTAESVLRSALLRKESRGSHNRVDYPQQDPKLEKQIIVEMRDGEIRAEYLGK